MARRYEFVEGSSSKFWEIELEGESFTARWGKIGTNGQEKTQDFESPAEARKAHDKLVLEKEKKGYKLVGGDDPGAKPLSAKAVSNPEMEAKLAEQRDDDKLWSVYADWLIEKGEGWGEVIAQAHAGKPATAKQEAAEKELGADGAEFEWKGGVIEHFKFMPDEEDEDAPMDVVITRVLKHPAGHLVRKLTLGLPPRDDAEHHMELVVAGLAAAGPLPLLEELDLAQPADHMDQPSWRAVGDARAIWEAAPRLKTLLLLGSTDSEGTSVRLGPIEAPHLEKLVFESSGLDASAPKDIGAAKLPKLQHLELYFGQEDYGCTSTVKSLAGIFGGKGLPALKRLGLKNSEWETELIDAVAASAILPRLEVLDFSAGTMFNDSAAALQKHAKKFAHLKELILEDNYFSAEHQAALKKVLPNAVFGEQKEIEDEDYRYVTVGE